MNTTYSPEVETIVKKIKEHKEKFGDSSATPTNFMSSFSAQEMATLLSAIEVAYILSAVAGRPISMDYVKRLRHDNRLKYVKKVSARSYVYRLMDLFLVSFKAPYKSKPGRRAKTQNEYPISVED